MARRDFDPATPFSELRREMDRLFDTFVGGAARNIPFRSKQDPPVNVWADTECVYVQADLPGMTLEDVEVQVIEDGVSIQGTRPAIEQECPSYHRHERAEGSFSRFIELPVNIDPEKVEAVLKHGVLTVTLPKVAGERARKVHVTGE